MVSKVYKLDPENQAKVSAGEGQSGGRAKVHPHIFNEEESRIITKPCSYFSQEIKI